MKINESAKSFINWWGELKFFPFLVTTLLLSYLIFLFFIPLSFILPPLASTGAQLNFYWILNSVIIAPVIETLLWQAGVIYLVDRLISKKMIIQIVISSVVFGLQHTYNVTYIVVAIYMGVTLATAFVLYERKSGWSDAYLAVVLVHALHNFITLFVRYFVSKI